MVLPFKIPHAGLQAARKRFFYWRVVNTYRFAMQNDFYNRKILHKFSRFFIGVMVIKALQKGARARKEEHLADYNTRKAAVEAAELSMWDEELALHEVNVTEAEKSVLRQRTVEWELREKPEEFAKYMMANRFPFRVGV